MVTLLIEKCQYNLGLDCHMTKALGSSGTMSMAMSSSYSYYCVINKKLFCCYLVSEIGILDNMRVELSSDD